MDHATAWMLARSLKLLAVVAYGAGVGIALGPGDAHRRKRAVHNIASPALFLVWMGGYVLTLLRGIPLAEAWIVGGFSASVVCHLFLMRAVRTTSTSPRQRTVVLSTLALAILLMVFRPNGWSVWA